MSFREGFGNALAGLEVVQAGFDRGTARRKENRLGELTAMQAQGQQPDYNEVAANGGNPMAFRNDAQTQQDRARETLGRHAGMLLAAPEHMRPAIYARILPEVRQFVPDAPDQYSPEIDGIAQQIVQQANGKPEGAPAQQRYLEFLAGQVPEAERQDVYRNAAGTNPRARSQIYDGRDGAVNINTGNNTATPIMEAGTVPRRGLPPNMMDFIANAKTLGGRVTSGFRTAREQADLRAAGKTTTQHSQHEDSTGVDIVFPNPQAKAQALAYAQANGINALDEGNHVHFGIPRGVDVTGAQLQPAEKPVAPPKPREAPAGYEWNDDRTAQIPIPGGPAQVAQDARQAALDAKKEAGAVRQAESATAASSLVTAIDTLTQSPGFADLGTEWGDVKLNTPMIRNDAKDANAQLKNVAGQIALATMARLKALSAVGATGFGALTAPELKLLENSLAALQAEQISNPELVRSLKVVRDTMDKVANWTPAASAAAPARSATYTVGQVIDHNGKRYRVTGGDPNDPDVEEVQ